MLIIGQSQMILWKLIIELVKYKISQAENNGTVYI